jgi:hypothetical protein
LKNHSAQPISMPWTWSSLACMSTAAQNATYASG